MSPINEHEQTEAAQRGYAPEVDHLGYARSDITDVPPQNVVRGLRQVRDKASGATITVDDRTFDATLHEEL